MKYSKIATVIIFVIALFIPLFTFNFEENAVSEIDNRMLTNNPFGENATDAELTTQIENYVSDRIGFRNEMISAYTLINNSVFGEMVHPSYTYGQDGYVFFRDLSPVEYSDFHSSFAKMVKEIQDYCQARNVPFVFVFNPAKASVLSDKLPEGVNYNNSWVDEFFAELDKMDVNYVNNTDLLIKKTGAGEAVFNRQYNAGHWNDLGAFYGVNNVLKNLQQFYPNIHINSKDEFTITDKLNTSLQVSRFPIYETEPIFTAKSTYITNKTSEWNGKVQLHNQYRFFHYTANSSDTVSESPKALVFQGSYMNSMGYKFLENSLSEYIAVHDYQNILNFEYYFDLFEPECVIFEVAEYTFTNKYFDYNAMKEFDLN